MVRLVHPAPGGQGTDPPKRRKGTPSPLLSLTPDEARCLRASLRNVARARYGTLRALAAALGVAPAVLTRRLPPSPGLAVALWRLTGLPLAATLTGQLAAAPSPAPEPAPRGAS